MATRLRLRSPSLSDEHAEGCPEHPDYREPTPARPTGSPSPPADMPPILKQDPFAGRENVTSFLESDLNDDLIILPPFAANNFAANIEVASLDLARRAASLALLSPSGYRCLEAMMLKYTTPLRARDGLDIRHIEGNIYQEKELEDEQKHQIRANLDQLHAFVNFTSGAAFEYRPVQTDDDRVTSFTIQLPQQLLADLSLPTPDDATHAKHIVLSYRLLHLLIHGIGHAVYSQRFPLPTPQTRQPIIGSEIASDWGFTLQQAVLGGVYFPVEIGARPYYVTADDGAERADEQDSASMLLPTAEEMEDGARKVNVDITAVQALMQWPSNALIALRRCGQSPHCMALVQKLGHTAGQATRIPFCQAQQVFTQAFWDSPPGREASAPRTAHSVAIRSFFADDQSVSLKAHSHALGISGRTSEEEQKIFAHSTTMVNSRALESDLLPEETTRLRKLNTQVKPTSGTVPDVVARAPVVQNSHMGYIHRVTHVNQRAEGRAFDREMAVVRRSEEERERAQRVRTGEGEEEVEKQFEDDENEKMAQEPGTADEQQEIADSEDEEQFEEDAQAMEGVAGSDQPERGDDGDEVAEIAESEDEEEL